MFEAITTIKGLISIVIWERYLAAFVFSFFIEAVQFVSVTQKIPQVILSLVPTLIDIVALLIAVHVKNK